jgi:uncharacterized protein
MEFPCTGCGACCRRVNKAVESAIGFEELSFPYKWDETGRCEKLQNDNRCSVYENRPLLCRVKDIGNFFGADEKEWILVNSLACNAMMDEDNIDLKYRIKI